MESRGLYKYNTVLELAHKIIQDMIQPFRPNQPHPSPQALSKHKKLQVLPHRPPIQLQSHSRKHSHKCLKNISITSHKRVKTERAEKPVLTENGNSLNSTAHQDLLFKQQGRGQEEFQLPLSKESLGMSKREEGRGVEGRGVKGKGGSRLLVLPGAKQMLRRRGERYSPIDKLKVLEQGSSKSKM